MKRGHQWRWHEATSPSTNHSTHLNWHGCAQPYPSPDDSPLSSHSSEPSSPAEIQLCPSAPARAQPHAGGSYQPLVKHADIYSRGPGKQQSRGARAETLTETTALMLPAMITAGKQVWCPPHGRPTMVHPPSVAPEQKQSPGGWARNRTRGFPSHPKSEPEECLQVNTQFSHLGLLPFQKN